jgi:pimeloyl-ACP methyl ester carboxylesterase
MYATRFLKTKRLLPSLALCLLHSLIPAARKVTMPGASHHPPVEQPREFNRISSDFLRKN